MAPLLTTASEAETPFLPSPQGGGRTSFFWRGLGLTLLIFGVGLLLHEGFHLVVMRALDSSGSM